MPYWKLFYHAVWATKHRLDLIDPAWEKDLYGYLWGKATVLECIPHAIGGMSDHIHVAISIPPKLAVATLIGRLKGSSSHHINEQYAHGSFLWQACFAIRSFELFRKSFSFRCCLHQKPKETSYGKHTACRPGKHSPRWVSAMSTRR